MFWAFCFVIDMLMANEKMQLYGRRSNMSNQRTSGWSCQSIDIMVANLDNPFGLRLETCTLAILNVWTWGCFGWLIL